jgi:hypothetical protein
MARRAAAEAARAARAAQIADEAQARSLAGASASASALGASASSLPSTQRTIPHMVVCKRTVDEVNALSSKAQVATGIPFVFFSNPHVREAVLATAELGQGFIKVNPVTKQLAPRMLSSKAFSTTELDKTDTSTQEEAIKIKKSVQSDTGGSITSDGMTNVTNRPLINLLYVTPSGVFYQKTIDTSGETKDAAYIADKVIEAIEAEGAEHVVLVVMDGACRSSFPFIEAKFPHIFCLVCVAHSLDLLLEDLAKEGTQGPIVAGHERFHFDTSWTRSLLADCRSLLTYLTNHQKPLAFYREIAAAFEPEDKPIGGTEPLKPGETRFATNMIAAERQGNCRSWSSATSSPSGRASRTARARRPPTSSRRSCSTRRTGRGSRRSSSASTPSTSCCASAMVTAAHPPPAAPHPVCAPLAALLTRCSRPRAPRPLPSRAPRRGCSPPALHRELACALQGVHAAAQARRRPVGRRRLRARPARAGPRGRARAAARSLALPAPLLDGRRGSGRPRVLGS